MTTERSDSGALGDRAAQAIVDEFDSVAEWTAEAVSVLGKDHALPASCRGSGSPAALDWLIAAMGLGEGSRLLDVGAGTGGPAAYAASARGVLPTVVDPMEGAMRGARRLFGWAGAMADGAALPFPDAAFDAVWSLGVLCTVPDKEPHLREMMRVVPPGESIGLLVYQRRDDLPSQPQGNHFPTSEEVANLCEATGIEIVNSIQITDFPAAPPEWEEASRRVEDLIAQRHGNRQAWQRAANQQQTIRSLIADGSVTGRLYVGRTARSTPAGVRSTLARTQARSSARD